MEKSRAYRSKRLFDIFFSGAALILLSPFLLIISLLVLVVSGWPVFYCQPRLGLGGRVFKMIKFRSMVKNADKMEIVQKNEHHFSKPLFTIENDPRLTLIGKFLRQTNLDELPQFVNVLRGQMSVVGPRPIPTELAKRENLEVNYLDRPGLTGPYQLLRKTQGIDEWTLSEADSVDRPYYQNQSLRLDLTYVVKTAYLVFYKIYLLLADFFLDKFNFFSGLAFSRRS